MRNFINIIQENSDENYSDRLVRFWSEWKKMRKECSDILKIYSKTGRPLIRAINKNELPEVFRSVSKNRSEEKGERREEVDAWFTEHGFKALRYNSIFCSNTIDQAFVYAGDQGKVFYIFPTNGFQYTWYQNSTDLYQDNFNKTLGNKELSIDELMHYAEPRQDGIIDMLSSNRNKELHFTGAYWAFDRQVFGQMCLNEIVKNYMSVGKLARDPRCPLDLKMRLGFKPTQKST